MLQVIIFFKYNYLFVWQVEWQPLNNKFITANIELIYFHMPNSGDKSEFHHNHPLHYCLEAISCVSVTMLNLNAWDHIYIIQPYCLFFNGDSCVMSFVKGVAIGIYNCLLCHFLWEMFHAFTLVHAL